MSATTDLAHLDELTGAYNRRFLSLLFGQRWRELMDLHGQLSLIIVDLDEFKTVNDAHGHLTGDDVLKATAQILREHFRQSDLIIRYGGDEFIIILPEVGEEEAARLAERAREAGAAHTLNSRKNGRPLDHSVAFSIGVASCPTDGQSGEELIAAADRRLYEDKAARRRFGRRPVSRVFVAGATTVGLALLFTTISRLGDSAGPPPLRPTPTPVVITRIARDSEAELLRAQLAQLQAQIETMRAEQTAAELAAKRLTDALIAPEPRRQLSQVSPTPAPPPTPDRRMAELLALKEQLRLREAALQAISEPRLSDGPTPTPTVAVEGTPIVATPVKPPVVTPPVLVSQVTPVYPRMAKALRKEATVRIRVIIDAAGRVIDAQPIGESAGSGFEEAARQAARKSKFRAGTSDSVAVQSEYILTYGFTLE